MQENGTKKKNGESVKEIILFPIDKNSVLTLIFAVLVNVIGAQISYGLQPPLWLDVIGTMYTAVVYGPAAGAVVGAVTSVSLHFLFHENILYIIVSMAIGIAVGFLFPRKDRKNHFAIFSVAILSGVISALISLPVNLHYYGGYTGNNWGNALYDLMEYTGSNSLFRAIASELFIDIPDRVFSIAIVCYLTSPVRTGSSKKKKKKAKTIAAGVLALAVLLHAMFYREVPALAAADKSDFESDYETVTYGSEDGILTAEVNAVTQTKDGYMWVGTYSGLYKYDGVRFIDANVDSRIKNVMCLFTDERGRLWIGTNDSGVFCYDIEEDKVEAYDSTRGIAADSVRSIGEDKEGNIYIGTVLAASKIAPEGDIKTFDEWDDIYYCQSFGCLEDGSMVGVTNGGVLFLMRDNLLLDVKMIDGKKDESYRSLAASGNRVMVGTSADSIEQFTVQQDQLVHERKYSLTGARFVNEIKYSPTQKGFFYCCENGMGFLDEETGRVFDMRRQAFDGAASDVCVDNQGNVWFASSKHGLMKYSRTPFKNVFHKAGLEPKVVNSVLKRGNELYVGTDSGLSVIDLDTYKELDKPYLDTFDNTRVRNLMLDGKNRIWVSTYGKNGLFRIENNNEISVLHEEDSDPWSGRCRMTMELSDGRILVATNVGLFFLQDDEVVAHIDDKSGLNNQYILSVVEREDGSILAASDGDGIYIIKNDRVIGRIGKNEGLNSLVVLRIVPCSEGYLYVTSNALYLDNGKQVRQLVSFPYSNNYDIQITEDGNCFVTSSAGLFVLPEHTLLSDEDYNFTLLNERWGLSTTFTSNSWNYRDGDDLYLCCTDGVRLISVTGYASEKKGYDLMLDSVQCGDRTYFDSDGVVELPASMDRISFNIAISNYSLSNLLVRYYLEGSQDTGVLCYQSEIMPLEFTNLPHGEYKLHIQVLDENTGDVTKESVFTIRKAAMMYEYMYFRIYLLFVCMLILFYFGWLIRVLVTRTARLRGLQSEITTDPMTGLLNKAGATAELVKVCSEEVGILMMIDLDSFKLVNDLYGHDMGDKILIRFGELIRESLGENDVAGRMGGDEFVGFAKNTVDEEFVEQFAQYLNREIVKSAKEYMGEDMGIPLGASIGAVRVPVSGTEFEELFKLADKALYVVKQNGKHGYSLYKKSAERKLSDEEDKREITMDDIKKIIGERNEGKGAYSVGFERMQVIYKYLCRAANETGDRSGFLWFRLMKKDGSEIATEVRDAMEEYLVRTLKKNDVVCAYSESIFVLSAETEREKYEQQALELREGFLQSGDYGDYVIAAAAEAVGVKS